MKRILIIENDILLLKTLKSLLEARGYQTVLAKDGKEALSYIEKEKFDLVLTDLMLPYASGMEILEKLKTATHKTPVIIVSASHSEDSITEGFNLGADDYIKKPFTPGELISRITRLIDRAE